MAPWYRLKAGNLLNDNQDLAGKCPVLWTGSFISEKPSNQIPIDDLTKPAPGALLGIYLKNLTMGSIDSLLSTKNWAGL